MAFYLPTPGVLYQVLHYMLGLKRLGYDVYYIEDSDRWVYDSRVGDVVGDATSNVTTVASLFERHGFSGRWGYRGKWDVNGCYGLTERQFKQHYRDSEALLNVTGQHIQGDQLLCRRRIYIESDPFATQVRVNGGDAVEAARLRAHDTHFTFGENIGQPDCGIPESGFQWLPTRQPIDIDLWASPGMLSNEAAGCYTTVTTWVSHVPAIEHKGELYHWQKGREFERFADLPCRASVGFQIAADGAEYVPSSMDAKGWNHVSATAVAGDADAYQNFIAHSRAEFTVARDQYVRPRTGWFSDRSACYLAAGRPVITEETGFSKFLPTGDGLFGFSSIADVLAAIDVIESDYASCRRVATEIASEYFAAEKVVDSLMQRAGLA
ncbi:MAG: hypothetical protein ABIO52_08080 [Gemmatimonadaceae bacterium]